MIYLKKTGQKITTGFQISYPELLTMLQAAGNDVTELQGAKVVEVLHANDGTGADSILIKVEKQITT